MVNTIVFCANRLDRGASGGGAGVMHLLRSFLDPQQCKYQIEYLYKNGGRLRFIWDMLKKGGKRKGVYYICHEPEAAALLAVFRRRYSLVYHQQGPYVEEYVSREEKPSRFRIKKKALYERLAFLGAEKVYFPSEGAAEIYFASRYATVKRSEVIVGEPLYNTIDPNEQMIPVEGIHMDSSYITFLSVGTFTKLKGQDQAFQFIKEYVETTCRKVRWITVGDGVLKQNLVDECNAFAEVNSRFKHIHFDQLPHGAVLYLDSVADIYIMLHRSSIFDLSTLEAMNKECATILSKIGGNVDFDKDHNCIFVDMQAIDSSISELQSVDLNLLKEKNSRVFEKYFSPRCFCQRYTDIMNAIH